MLRIRLRRTGRAKAPHYRVVVADQRAPRDGDFVEIVGHYNPRSNPKELVFKEERIRHWLAQGARPSETVHRLLHKEGLIEEPPPSRVTVPSRAEREAVATAAEAQATAATEAKPVAAAAATEKKADAPATGASRPQGGARGGDRPPPRGPRDRPRGGRPGGRRFYRRKKVD